MIKKLTPLFISQFLTTCADNIILFVCIGLLKTLNAANEDVSLLQQMFIFPYVICAAIVGFYSDSFSKKNIIIFTDIFKIIAVFLIAMNYNLFVCFAFIGFSAAFFSPAKYGLITEVLDKDCLIKANAIMESTTIIAILLGVVLGGMIADFSIQYGLLVTALIYLVSMLISLKLPNVKALNPNFFSLIKSKKIKEIVKVNCSLFKIFFENVRKAFLNKDIKLSLFGTSIFWGVGAVLRLFLILLIPINLNIEDLETPAYLNGVMAIGIAMGSVLASKYIHFKNINIVLYFGVLLGLVINFLSFAYNIYFMAIVLFFIGVLGGFFVVPLNALIQDTGSKILGSGFIISIQNFFENGMMLVLLAIYFVFVKNKIDINTICWSLSFLVTIWFIMIILLNKKKL